MVPDTPGRPRILVVDDTPANIRILSDALRGDYDLSVALSGPAALDIIADQEPPDLILLDIMMPDMDGYEVCERLKSDEATSAIPVIFVTAMSEASDEAKGLALGAADYITKPFNLDIVQARIRTHLSLAQARQTLERQYKELQDAANLREDVERITRHDLKNPLSTIISVPQLLLMADNLEDHQRDMIARVEESGYAMLSLINFSLDLFKMEQGTYTLTPEKVNLAETTRRVFRELEDLAGTNRVSLSLTINGAADDGQAECTIFGEELLCYSMLGNLIRNAVEAQPEGGTATISLVRNDEGTTIAVQNPGAVPEPIRDRFFEKYATHGKARGTGLGTYSAKLTAETLGGSIALDSSEQNGTTVSVHLPTSA